MLANQGAAGTACTALFATLSAANTAAATSAFIDVSKREGQVTVICMTGAITGTLTLTFNDATDSGGTGSAGITPNEGNPAVINSTTQFRKVTFDAKATRGFLQIVGTVVTGPVLLSYVVLAHPKYT